MRTTAASRDAARPGAAAPARPAPHAGPVVHTCFYLLLAASLGRFVDRHGTEGHAPWVFALSGLLAVLYAGGVVLLARPEAAAPGPRRPDPDAADAADGRSGASGRSGADGLSGRGRAPARPWPPLLAWLVAVVVTWLALVVAAPSFAWCAVPLLYAGLGILPTRPAVAIVVLLTGAVVVAQLRLAPHVDASLILGPAAVASVATAVFLEMRRAEQRQREIVGDLVSARESLAASERRAGVLAERERLAREIHDTVAQGTSSLQMLLQAADRAWDADPGRARDLVHGAGEVAARNLAETRRLVRGLGPADLAVGGLDDALRLAVARAGRGGQDVDLRVDGDPVDLPPRVQAALLRTAEGALANVREHAHATRTVLTLSYLPGEVALDIADDGAGFDPSATAPAGERGHGLPGLRARLAEVGGTLQVESAPGEGTVLAASVPLAPRGPAGPAAPAGGTYAAGPAAAADPAARVDPVHPVDPADPADPAGPADSVEESS